MRRWLRLGTAGLLLTAMAMTAATTAASQEGTPSVHGDVQRGARLFATECARCHGVAGKGGGEDGELFVPPAPALSDRLRDRDRADAAARIRDRARSDLTVDAEALRRRATDVESIARHLERLPTIDWRQVERGYEVYVDRCEICHGAYGRPTNAPPPGVGTPRDLSDPQFQSTVRGGDLVAAVRHGREGMPALVPRIADDDARDVAAFVRLLSPGMERYQRYCAACHGDDGRGAGSFAEAQPAPTVVFDRAYFERHDPDQVRASVWHMLDRHAPRMPHFAERLDDTAIDAIAAFLTAAR